MTQITDQMVEAAMRAFRLRRHLGSARDRVRLILETAFASCESTCSKVAVQHLSSCAIYNGPAYPPGPCDCGALSAGGEAQGVAAGDAGSLDNPQTFHMSEPPAIPQSAGLDAGTVEACCKAVQSLRPLGNPVNWSQDTANLDATYRHIILELRALGGTNV